MRLRIGHGSSMARRLQLSTQSETTNMIKLTKHATKEGETVIRVEGHLDAAALDEFRVLLDPCPEGAVASIDLTGVRALDADARRFLVKLRERGCRLVGGSLYINHLLEEVKS